MWSKLVLCALLATIAIVSAQNSTPQPSAPTSTASPVTTSSPTAAPTSVAPTVPPTPLPVPKPPKWNWNVTEGNHTCIKVQFAVQIVVKYNGTNHTELETGFAIPVNATVDQKNSFCNQKGQPDEKLVIGFVNFYNTSANLSLTFSHSSDNKTVAVEKIELTFNLTKELFPQLFPNETLYGHLVRASAVNQSLFKVASDHSYTCASQSAKLEWQTQESNLGEIQIDFLNSKVEAYLDENKNGQFDTEIDCKSSEISDVVPIAVGAALAGLVVIVLIAYFIGRRRSRRLAYQSV